MRADAVICGAGIAGAAAAWELTVRRGLRTVLVVDPLPPLSLTSDKSTECYRNWWPGPDDSMVRLMNRSIDLLERLEVRSGRLHLNRRGYAYVTADADVASALERESREIASLGAGALRIHRGASDDPHYPEPVSWEAGRGFDRELDGADLLLDRAAIRHRWPFLAADARAVLHARRCGWLSAQQLGMLFLEEARETGARLVRGNVVAIEIRDNRVAGVEIDDAGVRERIATPLVVNAAGPLARQVGALAGVDVPLLNELHAKVNFDDHLGVVPRDLPLTIWCDPLHIPWTEEERRDLNADPSLAWLTGPFPGGAHLRPEGGEGSTRLLLLWAFHNEPREPVFPLAFDPLLPEVILRGLTRMVPGLAVYFERGMRKPFVDGGYYCKTRENRLLVGPTGVQGFQLLCGLSGYGIMAAPAAAELLGAHVAGGPLPSYAHLLSLARYQDPAYLSKIEQMGGGQL
jgi:sarcosine oxidase, subunit beta